ncbi:hypothetical protein [Leeuwenhoekiella blandensis]|uniref:Uncharacterized protein n=1 Tax=Leeuwenhoekiella blandensis (strain CECT 7118 / CCUG 51940 / KCTC 22103 / MED217) TaxID=398720 RepID=A3XGX4_LEEBM|nr:hypothetical protein [Leeuwenhoekiella blandensis]EAQ51470.1 hypothetical protein MED217_18045 [Leeuwenhoekiella blandensis MED217]
MKNLYLLSLLFALSSFNVSNTNPNEYCTVTCTATATNFETGESYDFTRTATGLTCAGAESQSCALAQAAAEEFIRKRQNQQ